jgi:glutathione synthase/RimK-type ligase-like ATP-grasp enzyme
MTSIKNVFIFTNEYDETTNQVILWLDKFNKRIIRINKSEILYPAMINLVDTNLLKKPSKTNSCWFWRDPVDLDEIKRLNLNTDEFKQLAREFVSYKLGILKKIQDSGCDPLGNTLTLPNNKIYHLGLIKKFRLKSPCTIITNAKSKLKEFQIKHGTIVTKVISEAIFLKEKNNLYAQYTSLVDASMISKMPDFFFPSLFQEYIRKEFEIRTTYILGKFYSCAIFSQRNKNTTIDYRNYDLEKENRVVPYQLPLHIEKKLRSLLKTMKAKLASIDILKEISGTYYIIDLNLNGQFLDLSNKCNFFLEEEIAKTLAKHENKKKQAGL